MKRNINRFKKQQGFGIMSVILGIVASAVLLLVAFKTYQHAMLKIKINQAQDQIQQISSGVDSLYANFHDYSSITTKTVIDAGIVNKGDIVDSKLASPWYSSQKAAIVTVKPGSQLNSYTITMAKIPQNACSGIIAMFLEKQANNIKVNGTAVTDPATLAAACASNQVAELAISF